jgi:hypothetical protein
MTKKRKKKTPRRKKGHFTIGSVMNVDRRQEPERRAFEVQGEFETCVPCGTQKRRGLMCANCFGRGR